MRHRIKLPKGVGATIALVLGLAMIGYEGYGVYMSRRSNGWQTAEGVVTDSYRSGHKLSTPRVEYQYCVRGDLYTSKRISFGGLVAPYLPFAYDSARKVTARYPRGAKVTVHYDPADPAAAVLQPRYQTIGFVTLALGFILSATAIYTLLPDDKSKRSAEQYPMPMGPGYPRKPTYG
jgi:hypothetical protein